MANSRRANLPDVAAPSVEHAGLWLDRFLPSLPERGKPVERSPQTEHIVEAARIREPVLYRPAFTRWATALEAAGASLRVGVVEGRMAVGLGAESVLETAVSLSRTYGLPCIPGSALKGTAAAYARRFLGGDWAKGGDAYRTVFGAGGHNGQAGYVTFFDALYIPGSSPGGRPLEPDVLTVHHPDYYQGGAKPPADWDSPNPVAFVSATGAYLLALSGPSEAWVARSFELLSAALRELGVGAKTSSGYGRVRLSATPLAAADLIAGLPPPRPAPKTTLLRTVAANGGRVPPPVATAPSQQPTTPQPNAAPPTPSATIASFEEFTVQLGGIGQADAMVQPLAGRRFPRARYNVAALGRKPRSNDRAVIRLYADGTTEIVRLL